MDPRRPFIATYIMASGRNGTLYTGSTSNLPARVWQHKSHSLTSFTDTYDCTNLVWFEHHAFIAQAIHRERRIKKWLRDWKLALIERENPDWHDLAADWYPAHDPAGSPPTPTD